MKNIFYCKSVGLTSYDLFMVNQIKEKYKLNTFCDVIRFCIKKVFIDNF